MRRSQRLSRVFIAALAVASAAGATQIGPLGSEFLVNTFAPTREWRSKVAANASGFVVIWENSLRDGEQTGVFGQRFTSEGMRLGAEFQVNTYTYLEQSYPDVAMNPNGAFVVVWKSAGQDGESGGVFAQRFASNGSPTGLEFQVNTTYTQDEREPSVAIDADGDFVVVWTAFLGDGYSDAVHAQRFDSSGAKVGTEFLVNSHVASTQKLPQVAMNDAGFVVVWQSYGQDGQPDYGIFGRRFAWSNGAPLGVEFMVNELTFSTQWRADVAMGGSGEYVVVWESFQLGGDSTEVMARRFNSSGASQGGEFQVNNQTSSYQGAPAVAKDATGAFVVTWGNFTGGLAVDDIFARFFDSAGIAQDTDFRVNFESNIFTVGQRYPAVAATAASKFVVSWSASSGGAGDYDVYARRVTPYAVLDLDRDGLMRPLTDGMLALRYVSGFEGAALTAGALGKECTRCVAADIEDYAAGLGLVLDVNGINGVNPIDGLLLIRFLFGMTGAALEGTPEGGCTRCLSDDLVEYLYPLTIRQ